MTMAAKVSFAVYFAGFCYCMAVFTATTTTTTAQCQGNFEGLVQQCSRYVQKPGPRQNPSLACCSVIKNVDLPCVCQHITSQVERLVSMEKAAYVAASCGRPLRRGSKCGSYVVPGEIHNHQING